MNRTILVVAAVSLSACFQPMDEKNGLGLQGSPGGGSGGSGGAAGGGSQSGAGGGAAGPGDSICPTLGLTGSTVQPTGPCICTRRDVIPAGTCPRGQNQSASAMIGPQGGEVSLMGQQGVASGVAFTITFPPNAVATPTLITVTETNIVPPAGVVDWSPIYRIEPTDLVLAEAAKLRVPWSQGRGSSLGGGDLYWSAASTCTLEKLPSSYTNAGFAMGNVGRLGYAMVAYAQAGQATYCK